MQNVLSTVPQKDRVKTGVKKPAEVAKPLTEALKATYTLLLKTHVYHWNVEGPLFFAIHNLTDMQYQDLFAATDVIAERVRALGELTPMSPVEIVSGAKGPAKPPSAGEMVEELAQDHEALAAMLHDLARVAEEHDDIVTVDLATQRSTFHEKAAWMLRAILA